MRTRKPALWVAALPLALCAAGAAACPLCDSPTASSARREIFSTETFWFYLLISLLPLAASVVSVAVVIAEPPLSRRLQAEGAGTTQGRRRSFIGGSLLLGAGLGGFVDGIVLHQILQTHSMLSAKYPKVSIVNYQINMFWDGVFHAAMWSMCVAGIYVLWHAVRGVVRSGQPLPPTRVLAGSMLAGWGLFNLVEGIIDHHVLHLHHVVERLGVSAWDYAFLASGLLLVAVGWLISRWEPNDDPGDQVMPN